LVQNTGQISGTPTASGTWNFTIEVRDSRGLTDSKAFEWRILPTFPAIRLSAGSGVLAPGDQPTATVDIATGYTVPIFGTLSFSFVANVVNVGARSEVVCEDGSTSKAFTIPAGATRVPVCRFQAGTVAGTITFSLPTLRVVGRGQEISLPPVAQFATATISRSAPVIRNACLTNRSAGGFTVQVIGYSTPRELTQASFSFSAVPNTTVTPVSHTQPLTNEAGSWFRGTGVNYGGIFVYNQPFTSGKGDASKITSVSVTLQNSAGSTSATASGSCP
jgi:hypothetical protein